MAIKRKNTPQIQHEEKHKEKGASIINNKEDLFSKSVKKTEISKKPTEISYFDEDEEDIIIDDGIIDDLKEDTKNRIQNLKNKTIKTTKLDKPKKKPPQKQKDLIHRKKEQKQDIEKIPPRKQPKQHYITPQKPSRNSRNELVKRRERRNNIIKTIVIIIAILLSLALIVGAFLFLDLSSRFRREIQTSTFNPTEISIDEEFDYQFEGEGFFNVAIFGLTHRYGKEHLGTRANVIMIASLNKETREVRLVSIYRDTLLELNSGNLDIAGHAYAFGGSRETLSMINRNLDLNIEHYITLDFTALALTVNALNGVEIYIEAHELPQLNGMAHQMVNEGEFSPNVHFELPETIQTPGLHNLCGVQALAYSRIRSSNFYDNDFYRTERQRRIIQAMSNNIRDMELSMINDIIDILFGHLSTNLSISEILGYARGVRQFNIVETTGFPFYLHETTLSWSGATLIPDTLERNVVLLHYFLFGTENFMVSDNVRRISERIGNLGSIFIPVEEYIPQIPDVIYEPQPEIPEYIPEDWPEEEYRPIEIPHPPDVEEPIDIPDPPDNDHGHGHGHREEND